MRTGEILDNYGVQVTYLNPSIAPSLGRKSKIGGYESFLIEGIDLCHSCGSKRTAIIEIFKQEHPECYFPSGCDYLLVKTCYASTCDFDDDIVFYIGYGNSSNLNLSNQMNEVVLPVAFFEPQMAKEIPLTNSHNSELDSLIVSYGRSEFEELMHSHFGMIGTKLNGEPFAFQEQETPMCTCGERKDHFLQISSYEPNMHVGDKRKYWEWEPSLGLYIGGVGNYHYYICRTCGEGTIEAKWDSI